MKNVTIENKHDEHKVRMYLPDDMIDMTPGESEALAEQLLKAAKQARERVPPAPAPIGIDGHGQKGEKFCECGNCDKKFTCYVHIGHFEVGIPDAIKIRDWLNKALLYHNKNNCLE